MIITATALTASLFATICIDGTLHGQPKTICHEFQIKSYESADTCERHRKVDIATWLEGVAFLMPHLTGERCGSAESEGDDDI
jgi:hypothetical protein